MNDKECLYLMRNPSSNWYEEGKRDIYENNDILYNLNNLTEVSWRVGSLKKIFVGMKGIIKVSQDKRPELEEKGVKKLESGIYATFEVTNFFHDEKPRRVKIRVIDNFFKKNKIINEEKSKEILSNTKFNPQRGSGYIDSNTYKLVEAAYKDLYKDVKKPKKELITEEARKVYPRDELEKQEALILANYKCEVDENHTTFISKSSNKNYAEGHHLIPISKYAEFEHDVDVRANIVSLCPTCHRKLHSGIKADIDKVLEKLYHQRRDRLKKVGLDITIDKLKYIYSEDV